ncbi:MAG: hypothetical protein IPN89_15915 [Saprospiraceae bacterium]|nr:hypothetical protein [Saprospiraceae bacterium]
MFGKVKKILGIEGVKLELIVPEKISSEVGIVTGIIKLTSLSDDNIVEGIHLKMIEKYSRGRGENKLINEYPMGELNRKEMISISKNDIIELTFELDFVHVKSEMDKLGESNFLTKGLVGLAKKARGVKSEYTIRAEANIKGTTLNPFDIKTIQLI